MVNLVRLKRSSSVSSAGSKADAFWSPLVDENGKGTRLMWRLADSVFFHMQAQTRVWHGIDASQLFWLLCTAALEEDDKIDSRIIHLARYLDDAGIHHTPVIVNGQKVPTLDRLGWFSLMVWEAQTAPDYAHRWWASLVDALPLQDPHTKRPFPSAPPRACFPDKPVAMSKAHCGRQRSQTLQPSLPAQEPNYVFLPRVQTDTFNADEKRKEKEKEKGKLQKQKTTQNGNGLFSGADKSRLRKDKSAPPPVSFVTNGRMHKAHADALEPPLDAIPPRPRPQTATGHYETPRPVRQWPDTRGIPQLQRPSPSLAPQPATAAPKQRRGIMGRVLPHKAFRRSTQSLVSAAPAAPGPEETLVPVADVPAVSTTFGPEGEGMHSVVQRALGAEAGHGELKRPVPLMRRHSSHAVLSPLVEKSEAESSLQMPHPTVEPRPVSD